MTELLSDFSKFEFTELLVSLQANPEFKDSTVELKREVSVDQACLIASDCYNSLVRIQDIQNDADGL